MNTQPDCTTFREWLDLEVDGELPPERRSRLEHHLASCPRCETERRDLARLTAALVQARVAVRPGFRRDVLAALPAAGWEGRAPRAWGLPAAAFVLLTLAAVLVLGVLSPQDGPGSSVLGTAAAVGGLFRATALAGAGLLAASWKAGGLFVSELLASPLTLTVFAVLVLCLNLLLFSLLRRRRAAHATARGRDSGNPTR